MSIIEQLLDTARDAGKAILDYYTDEIDVEIKSDDSPLTKADLASHHVIIDALRSLSPEIPIISEEGGIADYGERSAWDRFWLVDPLDGTKEFIKRNGEFTVNIALVESGVPVLGVVHIPVSDLTYTGEKEAGSWKYHDGRRARIWSKKADKSRPLTVISSRSHGTDDLEEKLAGYNVRVGESISAGSSLKFCLVAEGKADIYPRFGPTMEWDTAAGDAVFRYSGRHGVRPSPLTYNKESLLNPEFIIGLE